MKLDATDDATYWKLHLATYRTTPLVADAAAFWAIYETTRSTTRDATVEFMKGQS